MNNKYKPVPFWSWNDELDENELTRQIDWMHVNGIGGFFMHARGGLTTPYLGEKWFNCIEACLKKAKQLNMEGYAYDENGWPSGFAGMKLLEDSNNRDCYLTYEFGQYDEKALVSYDMSGDKLVRVKKGNNCLNIYKHIASSTADILDEKVVRKFINLTHEQYKKHDIYHNLKGFFTDEPQYQRWHHPYTNVLPSYFKSHYNIDILDGLGLMFVEKEGYRDFRYKYWKAMQDLMLNSFAKQIYDWCEQNNYQLTGHYVEENSLGYQMMCCAGIMPFYEYEHIPGVDWLGRAIGNDLAPKQVSSVAQQLGKKQVLTECFACVGWDATPLELKHIAEFLFVNGVNLMCHHLLPYSEHGQRKRDYPEHYSAINPWVNKYFKQFNDYFSNIGEKIANSKEIVDVAIFNPIRSCYFDYKRELEATGFGVEKIDESLAKLLNEIRKQQINYHFIDETILSKYGEIEDDNLKVGNCRYKYLIFPLTYTMDKSTEKLLKKFVSNNGKILLFDGKPSYVEGECYDYSYLQSNVSFDEIKSNQKIKPLANENIRFSLRQNDNGKYFIYATNLGEETTWVIPNKCFKCGEKIFNEKIHFDKYESFILEECKMQNETLTKLKPIHLGDKFIVNNKPLNYLIIDFISYSFDNKSYSEPLHYMGIFDELLKMKYAGKLFLKYEFEVKDIPSLCNALIENTKICNVYVNDEIVRKNGFVLEKDLWKYDVINKLKVGKNKIVVEINYHQGEDVYYALFGEGVTESHKNCLAYETTIEAIYLQGDFGIYGDITKGIQKDDTFIGKNFYLGKQKGNITSLINDGFPFFRGEIELETYIDAKDVNHYLEINGRFQAIDVFVNDMHVGSMMFSNKLDISKHLRVGQNKVLLKLIVSNRNLLGPHHGQSEEDFSVGPYSYERIGMWHKGKSPVVRETYSFVKTII